MMIILLLVLVGVAWLVPIMWVAVGIFIVFWIVNKMADEKIADMNARLSIYDEFTQAIDDYDDEMMRCAK